MPFIWLLVIKCAASCFHGWSVKSALMHACTPIYWLADLTVYTEEINCTFRGIHHTVYTVVAPFIIYHNICGCKKGKTNINVGFYFSVCVWWQTGYRLTMQIKGLIMLHVNITHKMLYIYTVVSRFYHTLVKFRCKHLVVWFQLIF